MTWHSLFGEPTGKLDPKRKLGKPFSEWRILDEDTVFDGIPYAKGSKYRVFESENFGHVYFHIDSKCPDGTTPAKHWHKF